MTGALQPTGPARGGGTSAEGGAEADRRRGGRLALIADLLARAEGSDSPSERELALARAQKEAARHGIDLAEAAYANLAAGRAPEPEERTVTLGTPRTPGLRTFAALYLTVAEVNGIKCLISRDSSRIFAHGMPTDLDMAETLYASLLVQMDTGAEEWLATGTYLRERTRTGAAPNKGVARRSFRKGFTARTAALLITAAHEAKEEALAEAALTQRAHGHPGTAMTSTALALRAKEKAVEDYHQQVIRDQGIRSTWRPRDHASTSPTGYRAGERHAERTHRTRRR